jgi:carboxymethylenebutenolidase
LSGLSAAAPYYGGGVTTEAETARQPRVPVMAHFADEDKWIPLDTVETFKKVHPSVQVFTYAAHHGFNCDQRGSWHAPSAQLARERTLAFFKQHLS